MTDIRHVGHSGEVTETEPLFPLSRYVDDRSEETITQVYLALLREHDPSRERLLSSGLLPGDIDRAVGVLHWRGWVDVSDPDNWTVAAPDIALPAYASAIERQARRSRAAADEMAHIFHAAREGTEEEDYEPVRVLNSVAELRGAMSHILSHARHSVLVMRAAPLEGDGAVPLVNLKAVAAEHAEARHLTFTALYDSALADLPEALDVMRAREVDGESLRVAPSLPFSALVVDESTAVLDFRNVEPSGGGSLLVHSGPLTAAVVALFRRLFDDGIPLSLPGRGSGAEAGITERDRIILGLLASGASDSMITRQVGVSRRTVERRIHHLMTVLSASTRFQAGVEAARRGLI